MIPPPTSESLQGNKLGNCNRTRMDAAVMDQRAMVNSPGKRGLRFAGHCMLQRRAPSNLVGAISCLLAITACCSLVRCFRRRMPNTHDSHPLNPCHPCLHARAGKRKAGGVDVVSGFMGLGMAPHAGSMVGPVVPGQQRPPMPPPAAPSPTGSSNTGMAPAGAPPVPATALAPPGLQAGQTFSCTIDCVMENGYMVTLDLAGHQLYGMLYKKLPEGVTLKPGILPHQPVYPSSGPPGMPHGSPVISGHPGGGPHTPGGGHTPTNMASHASCLTRRSPRQRVPTAAAVAAAEQAREFAAEEAASGGVGPAGGAAGMGSAARMDALKRLRLRTNGGSTPTATGDRMGLGSPHGGRGHMGADGGLLPEAPRSALTFFMLSLDPQRLAAITMADGSGGAGGVGNGGSGPSNDALIQMWKELPAADRAVYEEQEHR